MLTRPTIVRSRDSGPSVVTGHGPPALAVGAHAFPGTTSTMSGAPRLTAGLFALFVGRAASGLFPCTRLARIGRDSTVADGGNVRESLTRPFFLGVSVTSPPGSRVRRSLHHAIILPHYLRSHGGGFASLTFPFFQANQLTAILLSGLTIGLIVARLGDDDSRSQHDQQSRR
jgi:hypothetical protein